MTSIPDDRLVLQAGPQGRQFAKSIDQGGLESAAEPHELQVVRKSRKLFDVLAEDGIVRITVVKTKLAILPVGSCEWKVQDAQDKSSSPLIVKRKAFNRIITFEDVSGGLMTSVNRKWYQCNGQFTWHSLVYKWKLVWFSLPVRLELVEASSGKKVADLQGSWDLPCLKQGPHNYRDHITVMTDMHDSAWVRIVVASGMHEADRHRRNRCITSQLAGGGG